MKRNKFSLSHYRLYSSDMAELVPAACVEVLPGDTIQHATNLLVRCSPLLAPVMHPVHVRIHHWFVPHRLVWDDWEDFITGGPDGMDDSVFPFKDIAAPTVGTLSDYLGIPPAYTGSVSALPYRGYSLIWNEFYRDQDLQAPLTISTESGTDTTTNVNLQNVCWEKDYFTSSRPWEQKGPSVSIPLTGLAPVSGLVAQGTASATGSTWYGPSAEYDITAGSPLAGVGQGFTNTLGVHTPAAAAISPSNRPQFFADLTDASAITINALREALALQRYEEARARYGSRYVEYLRYLGVRSSDARLQRPEYLGGGKQTIQFSEVLQTGPGEDTGSDVGALKGHGIAGVRSNRYRRFFEEHGYVFTLVSVLPKTMYMNGIQRSYNRRFKDDFWQKEFEHIGQQVVTNREVYATHASPDATFGYQDRYDEYRRAESGVAGEFRTTLNYWHLARDFSSAPALNETFVKAVPTERVFAVNSADVLWVMARHNIQARRMLAKTGTSFIF